MDAELAVGVGSAAVSVVTSEPACDAAMLHDQVNTEDA
jgi:hypothetical protein